MTRPRKGVALAIKTLEPGWHDKDVLILHAVFQLLIDFVDLETPYEVTDWTHDDVHRKAWEEISALYRWWKKERPKRQSPLHSKRIRTPPHESVPIPGTSFRKTLPPDKKKYAAYYRAMSLKNKGMNLPPTHPGKMLREDFMPDYKLTVSGLAESVGVSRQSINELLRERRSVSPEMAIRLSKLFGNSPDFWLNAQRAVDLWDTARAIKKDVARIKPLRAA